jgi:hypothetical protein
MAATGLLAPFLSAAPAASHLARNLSELKNGTSYLDFHETTIGVPWQ